MTNSYTSPQTRIITCHTNETPYFAPMAFATRTKKDCYVCEQILNPTSEAIEDTAEANIDKLKSKIDMYKGYSIPKVGSPRGNVIFLRKSFKEIISHGGNKEEIQCLLAQFKFEDVEK